MPNREALWVMWMLIKALLCIISHSAEWMKPIPPYRLPTDRFRRTGLLKGLTLRCSFLLHVDPVGEIHQRHWGKFMNFYVHAAHPITLPLELLYQMTTDESNLLRKPMQFS